MVSIDDIIKNFKIFCSMCEGKYNESILPQCIKSRFTITLDVVGSENKIIRLLIKIVSVEGDTETFQLSSTDLLDVSRISENDSSGALRYYTLIIITSKGELLLKKDIKENRLIVSFNNRDIKYESTVLF